MELFQQGRFIRALETCPNVGPIDSPYTLENPIQEIQKYSLHFLDAGCGIHTTWQAIVEEAIDVFEKNPRTNLINENDAYQILQTSLSKFVLLSPKTKTFVTNLLQQIHASPQCITQIVTTKQTYNHGPHFIDNLLSNYLISFPHLDHDQIIFHFITNLPFGIPISHNLKQLILKDFNPLTIRSTVPCDKLKLNIILKEAMWMSHNNYNPPYDYPINIIHDVLVQNINLHYSRVSIELATWTCQNKSTFYTLEEAANILHTENIHSPQTIHILANLILTNQITLATSTIISIVNGLKQLHTHQAHQIAKLLEQNFPQIETLI